jgi:glycine dehydrogenase subunit 2
MRRGALPTLPELAQPQVLRHYLRLSQQTLGMDLGTDISEGTTTQKYSPKLHEQFARSPQMSELHPLQPDGSMQGLLRILYGFGRILHEVSGMDEFSFQPAGGAHAVFTAACIMRRYHDLRGELAQRNEIITTIFSHPCDSGAPASAGFKVVSLMPEPDGLPSTDSLEAAVSERTAGIMITNPEDTGIYNPRIDEFVRIVRDAGGVCFQDQANANGVLGITRARDAGFDMCHFNLHKTFSSPHGSEGPATGALAVTEEFARFLPVPVVTFDGERYGLDYDRPDSVGKIRSFLGSIQCVLRAYSWAMSLGGPGLREVAEVSVINNNYLQRKLLDIPGVSIPYGERPRRLDQVRYSLEELARETGIGTDDVHDRMVDFGIQSYWTSHHPWIVPEPFTPEPCETYSKEDCDEWAAVIARVCREAREDPDLVRSAPHNQTIARVADPGVFEDPARWAMTWRAFRRKRTGDGPMPTGAVESRGEE